MIASLVSGDSVSTIDHQNLAGDEIGGLAGQECDCTHQVLRLPHPAERDLRHSITQRLRVVQQAPVMGERVT